MANQKNSKFQLTSEDITAYANGEDILLIAQKRKVSTTTIRTHLNKAGIKTNRKNRQSQVTPEEINAYKNGESIPSIAKRKNVSPETIRNHFKKAGIQLNGKQSKVHLTIDDVQAYKNGETIQSISAKTKVSPTTIRKRLKENNVEIKVKIDPQFQPTFKLSARDIWDYKQGKSASAIGRGHNVSATSIIRELKKANIKTRTFQDACELLKDNSKYQTTR